MLAQGSGKMTCAIIQHQNQAGKLSDIPIWIVMIVKNSKESSEPCEKDVDEQGCDDLHIGKYWETMSKIDCFEASKERAHNSRPMSNEPSDPMYEDGHYLDSNLNVPKT